MKIVKIEVNGFRLLNNFSLDLEDNLSLIIGKNNTGKTSVLTVLDKFINSSDKNKITAEDFNLDLKKTLTNIIDGNNKIKKKEEYTPIGLNLNIFIKYDEDDDLSQVSPVIMSLDPDDNNIVLSFEYSISHSNITAMKKLYQSDKEKFNDDPSLFFEETQREFFGPIRKKSLRYNNKNIFIDLAKEGINIQSILSFDYISAKRSVTNKENDKTLSAQTARIYKKASVSDDQNTTIDDFKKKLRDTDEELDKIYGEMFSSLLEKVSKFGGLSKNETDIKISSSLQHRELLDTNTTVLYSHNDSQLPEHYNGLGYMNLISMIFEIEILMAQFRRTKREVAASINLLFIEEPEAHTHPQMQYIFINNIKSLLSQSRVRDDGISIQLQTVISTHSSHIVSECDFDDVKYLKRSSSSDYVSAKNLKSLRDEYSSDSPEKDIIEKRAYKFLKQYLTLNRSELFFADKAILIEGDTERILIPAMMKKIDHETSSRSLSPLLSQNISIIEVGAYSQIFEKFIDFIGLKTLIITDIDSYYDVPQFDKDGVTPLLTKEGVRKSRAKKCPASDVNATKVSNDSLLYFHNKPRGSLVYFKDLNIKGKSLSKINGKWVPDEDGTLLLCYQTSESDYHARSFEDSFFNINKGILGDDANKFPSLTKKWFDKYIASDSEIDVFKFSEKAVGSKPSLAIEILLNSETVNGEEFSNWYTPDYISEGLKWLQK